MYMYIHTYTYVYPYTQPLYVHTPNKRNGVALGERAKGFLDNWACPSPYGLCGRLASYGMLWSTW